MSPFNYLNLAGIQCIGEVTGLTCQTTTSREQGRELVRIRVGCSASVASRDLVARAISPGAVILMCLNAWNSEFTCSKGGSQWACRRQHEAEST